MTERKSFKRRVRARMEKTGERYTAARRHVESPEPEAGAGAGERVTSDDALTKSTGKTWDEWFALLDEWGAREHGHREIAAYLRREHGIGGWWAQSITVGWERARGLRAKHQGPTGFAISATRTIGVRVDRLYSAFAEPGERARWLPEEPIGLRTAQPGRSARFDWSDGTSRLHVYFTDKGDRSAVTVQHERLADAGEAERMKAFWRGRLDELKRLLERRPSGGG